MKTNPLPFRTKSLILRRFVPEDARRLFTLSNEVAFRRWLPSQVYSDESHARSALEFLIDQYSSPAHPRHGPYVLAIEHRTDRALIGHVGFSSFQDEVEIGFAIAQQYQGRGFAAEAVIAASRWAIGEFGLQRIIGIAAAANSASIRTLLRAGFVHQENRVMVMQGVEQPVSILQLSTQSVGGAAPMRRAAHGRPGSPRRVRGTSRGSGS